MVSFTLKVVYTGGTTCGKGGRPSVAAIIGLGGPSTAKKIAVDSPGGPLAAGDQLRRDRPHFVGGPPCWGPIHSVTTHLLRSYIDAQYTKRS